MAQRPDQRKGGRLRGSQGFRRGPTSQIKPQRSLAVPHNPSTCYGGGGSPTLGGCLVRQPSPPSFRTRTHPGCPFLPRGKGLYLGGGRAVTEAVSAERRAGDGGSRGAVQPRELRLRGHQRLHDVQERRLLQASRGPRRDRGRAVSPCWQGWPSAHPELTLRLSGQARRTGEGRPRLRGRSRLQFRKSRSEWEV